MVLHLSCLNLLESVPHTNTFPVQNTLFHRSIQSYQISHKTQDRVQGIGHKGETEAEQEGLDKTKGIELTRTI